MNSAAQLVGKEQGSFPCSMDLDMKSDLSSFSSASGFDRPMV